MPISSEALQTYLALRGDAEALARSKLACQQIAEDDWAEIDRLVQAQVMCVRGLVSLTFEETTAGEIRDAVETARDAAAIRAFARAIAEQ